MFSDILQVSFPYAPKSRKAAGRPPKSGENPTNRRRRRLKGAFSRLRRVVQRARSSGSAFVTRPQCQTTMDDDLTNVQRYPGRYPVELGPEPQLVRDSILIIRGPIGWPWFWEEGRGKLAKIEVALSNWLIELGGYQGKLLGEQLRKDGASRPRDPRGQVRFPPLRVSDQAADVAVGIDEVRAGERALKAETAKR